MTEAQLQEQIVNYLCAAFPRALFHSDFGSGIKLTNGMASRQMRQQGGRKGWPDLTITEPRNGYHGLFIELKKEGTKIYLKDGVTVVANEHIQNQHDMLADLEQRGYKAVFACGFDEAQKVIDEYLK